MLRTERRPGPVRDVLVVTVDRPERRNALDLTTVRELRAVAGDTTVGAVVLTGAPPAFCAGADLTGVDSEEFGGELSAMLEAWDRWPAVRIAAIDGPALGAGTQLALVCDLRVASAGSEFGIPAARLGLAVDQWTVDRLVDEFGWPVARSILSGWMLRRSIGWARSTDSDRSTMLWAGRRRSFDSPRCRSTRIARPFSRLVVGPLATSRSTRFGRSPGPVRTRSRGALRSLSAAPRASPAADHANALRDLAGAAG